MPKKNSNIEEVEEVEKTEAVETPPKKEPVVRKITVTNLKQRGLVLPYKGSQIAFKGLETQELVYDAESFKVLKQYENLKFITIR